MVAASTVWILWRSIRDGYTRRMTRNAPAQLRRFAALALLPLLAVPPSFGWGDVGHKMINRLAAEGLPADVPAFLRSAEAMDEIEYLGPEPDRWRCCSGDLAGSTSRTPPRRRDR